MGILLRSTEHHPPGLAGEIHLARQSFHDHAGLLPRDRFWDGLREAHDRDPWHFDRRHPTIGGWIERDEHLRGSDALTALGASDPPRPFVGDEAAPWLTPLAGRDWGPMVFAPASAAGRDWGPMVFAAVSSGGRITRPDNSLRDGGSLASGGGPPLATPEPSTFTLAATALILAAITHRVRRRIARLGPQNGGSPG